MAAVFLVKKIAAMKKYFIILTLLYSTWSFGQTVLERGISPDGPIQTLERKGDTLYAAGLFDKVGYATGAVACFSGNDILPDLRFPYINGEVYAIISDGNDGWFLGGKFELAESYAIHNLVHIFPDFTIDTAFNLAINNEVSALARKDNLLYVGGRFTEMAGEPRQYLGAYDLNAQTLAALNPKPDNYIRDLDIYDNSLLAAGLFSAMDAVPASGLARIDLSTGAIETMPPANGHVHTLLLKGDTLFAGGAFPGRLMAVELPGASLLSWAPAVSGFGFGQRVNALAMIDTLIYLGGYFGEVDGQARKNLAAVSLSGHLAPFSPNPDGEVFALLNVNGKLAVGGEFYQLSGENKPFAAKLDPLAGEAEPWSMNPDWSVNVWLKNDDLTLAGGEFRICQYVERDNAFALNLTDFSLLDWDPKTDFLNIPEIAVDKSRNVVYLAGWATEKLKAVDGTTGDTLPGWSIETDKAINAVVVDSASGTVFIAGQFDVVEGQSRTPIASFDPDGNLLPLNTEVDGEIMDVALYNNSLYLAEHFNKVGGLPRSRLAAVDLQGNLLTWDPKMVSLSTLSYYPKKLEPHKGRIYVAGWFPELNDEPRTGSAAIDAVTGELLPWNLDSDVIDILHVKPFNNGIVVTASHVQEINSVGVNYLSFVDEDSGKVLMNVPDFGFNVANSIEDLLTMDTLLIAGGAFQWIEGRFHPHLAFLPFPEKPDGLPDPSPLPDPEPEPEVTAVDSPGGISVLAYPNPAAEAIYIESEALAGYTIFTLSDLAGRIVLKKQYRAVPGKAMKIDVSGAPKGLYIVRLITGVRREYFKLLIE